MYRIFIDITLLENSTITQSGYIDFVSTFSNYRIDNNVKVIPYASHTIDVDGDDLEVKIDGTLQNYSYVQFVVASYILTGNADLYDELVELGIVKVEEILGDTLINLYVNKSPKIQRLKTLLLYDQLDCNILEPFDVINPSILITYPAYPNAQMVYITAFDRYYFINKVTCVRKELYQLDLHVDVLRTYSSDLSKQSGFVTRMNDSTNKGLVDIRRPLKNKPTITYTDVTGGTNANFSFNPLSALDFFNIVLITLADRTKMSSPPGSGWGSVTPPIGINLPSLLYPRNTNEMIYVMDITLAESLLGALYANSPLTSFVQSLIYYPFNIDSFNTYLFVDTWIHIDDETIGENELVVIDDEQDENTMVLVQ